MTTLETLIQQFEQALLAVDRVTARKTLLEVAPDWTPLTRIDCILTPALERIGQKWEVGAAALSQVYMSGIICEELVNLLLPASGATPQQTPVAITTFEDQHVLGKRIVLSVLRAHGLNARDYGAGKAADELVRRVRDDQIQVLLVSTLMFPAALHVKDLRAKLNQAGLPVKIIVGGVPFRFDDTLWRTVEADAMGRTATDAVTLTRAMLKEVAA